MLDTRMEDGRQIKKTPHANTQPTAKQAKQL